MIAEIRAKVITIEGEVRGNLTAGEQILIRKTATMLGNLAAPRVGLEDGCRFKGSVDMESAAAARPGPLPVPPAKTHGGARPEPIPRGA